MRVEGIKVFLTAKQKEEVENNVWMSEYMRYAGHCTRPDNSSIGLKDTPWYLIIYCPKGLSPTVWAEQNCQRMKSFGFRCEPYKR